MNCENIILGGDFNLAMDIDQDEKGVQYNNNLSLEMPKKKMSAYTLVDAWRIRNHKKFTFTWKRSTLKSLCQA